MPEIRGRVSVDLCIISTLITVEFLQKNQEVKPCEIRKLDPSRTPTSDRKNETRPDLQTAINLMLVKCGSDIYSTTIYNLIGLGT